ncbi:MAG TPA: hypothetical protein PKC39_06775 [Ferruginibacter sp.]|nr:hypothetical protein [Ferruginibacter sp.]HMP20643.1 hypothetical protein [Ferruginibacter sp.]
MNRQAINQELVLNLNASFCQRQWCLKQASQQQNTATSTEQLKMICWDGMLPEIFPNIVLKADNKPLVIWELLETEHMLHLKMGEFNARLEADSALHPYFLLQQLHAN